MGEGCKMINSTKDNISEFKKLKKLTFSVKIKYKREKISVMVMEVLLLN